MPNTANVSARTPPALDPAAEPGLGPARTPRRRPKDRKEQIVRVAAESFSARGYNEVGIDDIAAAVGISGPALYRHFPNKYALFRHVVLTLADVLVAACEVENPSSPGDTERYGGADPGTQLGTVLRALIAATIEQRTTGGLYRWEERYLTTEDREAARARIALVNRSISAPLTRLRPGLEATDTALLSAAALSVVGSITAHRTPLADKRIEALLHEAAWSVLTADVSAWPEGGHERTSPAPGLPSSSKREQLLQAALHLFYERGYHDVSIEEIGSAAELNASGVYRYFDSKADLLAAIFTRASERLTAATTTVLATSATPIEALHGLTRMYVRLSFAQTELMHVYYAEVGGLPEKERSALRAQQRDHIEEWVALLKQPHPTRPAAELRFLVHAALGLVLDVGQLLRFDSSAAAQGTVSALMAATLLLG